MNGELAKVTIKAFKNVKLTQEVGTFVLPVNPEGYSQNYKVSFNKVRGQGNEGTDIKYKFTNPENLEIEFLFDGTNTIEGYTEKKLEVKDQIEQFLKLTYRMNSDTHKPNFLKIFWGKQFVFYCIMESVDINYTLFHPNGHPLRAKVKAKFVKHREKERRVREEDKKSPDLTHVRQVKEQDTIPNLAYEVYGDANLYLQIAKANQLTSFRRLTTGQEIIFPPYEKNTNE